MNVRDAALEIIRLAESRNAEDQSIDQQLGIDIGQEWGSESALATRLAERPAERMLSDYLAALPPAVLFKLRALMYAGRGDSDDVIEVFSHLSNDLGEVDAAVASMVEKSPLPRYLQRGLEVVAAQSIQLDGDWRKREAGGAPLLAVPVPRVQRTFPVGNDPVNDGGKVFVQMAAEWTGDSIQGAAEIERFFNMLQDRTRGFVILDFIDMASWDCLDGHAFDVNTGYLELYWHDFRDIDADGGRTEFDATFFPASLYGLLVLIQEIRIIRGKDAAAFLLKGHTLDRKEIRNRLAHGADDHNAVKDRFFSSRFVRRIGNQIHVFDVLATPLYTAAILPKAIGLPTAASRNMLLAENLRGVRASLQRATITLQHVPAGDPDTICEKANTIRRNWEQALKIELVYRDIRPNESYNSLLLGDLLKLLKDFHRSSTSTPLGTLISWANELSHDAGRAIEPRKAQEIAAHVITYVDGLRNQIRLNPFPR